MPVRLGKEPLSWLLDKNLKVENPKPLKVSSKSNVRQADFLETSIESQIGKYFMSSAYSSLTCTSLLRFDGTGPVNKFLSRRLLKHEIRNSNGSINIHS